MRPTRMARVDAPETVLGSPTPTQLAAQPLWIAGSCKGSSLAWTPASGFVLTSPEYERPGSQADCAQADGARTRNAVASTPTSARLHWATCNGTSGSIAACGKSPHADNRPALSGR